MQKHKILNIYPHNSRLQEVLSNELKISKVLAQILINRGIKNPQEANRFLEAKLDYLLDPFSFSDMSKAVHLLKKAAVEKEAVMIYGDYDVDGVTSVALLKSTLLKMGLDVLHHIPHRIRDGYGLNKNVLQLAKEKKIKILVTVDCGTSSHAEIKDLENHGIKVIITDHHEPLNTIKTAAYATINPKIKDCAYGYKDLAGVGVVYKLCQALTGKKLSEELDLVSLGTIADVVPLTGENRIIVKEGLLRLTKTEKVGINALVSASRIKKDKINSGFVSFILGPRINASGRVDSAETALKLLMSLNKTEAEELALSIESHNRQRQKIETQIIEEANDLINKEINFKDHKIIVIAKEGWHQGVLGIVAAKLADRFHRPTIVISVGENLCKGSGRSIRNFHLFSALLACKDFLREFGGHSHAVGLVVTPDNLTGFKDKINHFAREKLTIEDLLPNLDADIELGLSDLNHRLKEELNLLEPFGAANSEPLFYSRNLKVKGQPQVFSRDTLKFWVTDGEVTYPAIGFGMGGLKDSILGSENLDLVYSLGIDNWGGNNSLILQIKDVFFQ